MTMPSDAPLRVAESSAPARLSGAAIGDLRDLINGAFGDDELEMLVKISLDLDLTDFVEKNSTKMKKVFDLLQEVERKGYTVRLLRAVVDARPGRPELSDAIARYCPQALETPPSSGDQAQTVAAAVTVLKEQADASPAVRDVIVASREKLDQLMEDIDVLYNYKLLHDCLHTIQLSQYPNILYKVKQLRLDLLTSPDLEEEIFALQDISSDARKAAQSLPDKGVDREQEMEWVGDLDSAIAKLRKSVKDLDTHDADRAVYVLKRIIRDEPARINRSLTVKAKKLALDELSETIRRVIDSIGQGGAAARELQNALVSLRDILPNLRGRVAEHKEWQGIENDLWEAEDCIERGTPESMAEFFEAWREEIKPRIESLARAEPTAEWAQATGKHAALIVPDAAGNISSVATNFKYFRKAALFHFFQVDKALRAQCAEILKIRPPLRSLLNTV